MVMSTRSVHLATLGKLDEAVNHPWNFESFLDCEDGNNSWTSGCSTLPPGGLGKKSVHFTSDQRYPAALSTFTLDMTLPLNLSVYRNFKSVMTEVLVSGQGFGNI